MKKYLLLVLFGIFNVALQAQNLEWVKSISGPSTEDGDCIGVDHAGNVITGGQFYYTVDLDPGSATYSFTSLGLLDICITKLDAAGNFVWGRSIGGASYDVLKALKVDNAGNIYATGFFEGTVDFDPGAGVATMTASTSGTSRNAFILKLDMNGNYLWAKTIGDYAGDGNSIILDALNNSYVTGTYSGNADFDPGPGVYYMNPPTPSAENTFILKLNASGDFVWAKSIDNMNYDGPVRAYGIGIDASNNTYITGSLQGDADFDPGPGTYTLSSNDVYGTPANADIFLCKLDASGNFVWAKSMGKNTKANEGKAIAVDGIGNSYITGVMSTAVLFDSFSLTVSGNTDIFVCKFNAAGACQWARNMGGTGSDFGWSIAQDAFSNVYTSGFFNTTGDYDPGPSSFTLTSAGATDIFISKLDQNGDFLWAESFGSLSSDRGNSITTDANSNVYVTGNYNGTVDFDFSSGVSTITSYTIPGGFSQDMFVLKLGSTSVGITDVSLKGNYFGVYPNPNEGLFTISSSTDVDLTLTNSLGQVLQMLNIKASEPYSVYFEGLAPGIYFLTGQSSQGAINQKIIITD